MFARRGFRLGRVHGVEITVDPSWFIFAAVITYLLGQSFTAQPFPVVGSTAAGYALGMLGAVLFFVSVLAHELSHAVVAQRKGIQVPRITLFIFGGVAWIAEEPHSAGDEVKIALAGPALSFVLGALLLGLGTLANRAGSAGAESLFRTLGGANLFLGLFNLLPGFPLDGGRVLRAAVWGATGDMAKGTRVAATAGRVIAVLMILTGGAETLIRGDLSGVWLVFIGLFLYQSAQAAYRSVTKPASVPVVGQLMTPAPMWIPAATIVDDGLYQRLATSRDRAFPVVGDNGMIAGVLTAEAVEATPRDAWPFTSAAQLMAPMHAGMVAGPGEALGAVASRLPMNPVGRFVVLDAGRLVGLLTPALLTPALLAGGEGFPHPAQTR